MEQNDYGSHLIFEGYDADATKLHDLTVIYQLLDELPGLIGMEKIGPPHLVKFDGEDKAGITGVVLIVTSHISIHTYSLKGCLFLDVFSCKCFDPTVVIELVIRTFGVGKAEHTIVRRGVKFPPHNIYPVRTITHA